MVMPPSDPPVHTSFLSWVMSTDWPCAAANWAVVGATPGGGGWAEERGGDSSGI